MLTDAALSQKQGEPEAGAVKAKAAQNPKVFELSE